MSTFPTRGAAILLAKIEEELRPEEERAARMFGTASPGLLLDVLILLEEIRLRAQRYGDHTAECGCLFGRAIALLAALEAEEPASPPELPRGCCGEHETGSDEHGDECPSAAPDDAAGGAG